MFNFWEVSTFGTILVYGILYDFKIILIWLVFLATYIALGLISSPPSMNSNRRKVRMATWNAPTEPNCYVKLEVNTDAIDKFIAQKEKEGQKVTYTAIALKAIGNAYNNRMHEHGKIVFNRYHILNLDSYTLKTSTC